MVAVDTNILVRLLTNDDPGQARKAADLLNREEVWIARTVLLETAWVLRYFYNLAPAAIHRALARLLGLPNVRVEDPHGVGQALQWFAGGLDFADALHLSASTRLEAFVTFDRKLIRKAGRLEDAVPARMPGAPDPA